MRPTRHTSHQLVFVDATMSDHFISLFLIYASVTPHCMQFRHDLPNSA